MSDGTELVDRLRNALSDRYHVEEEVGRGGMAFVFRARDLKHDRTVAIKVLREELTRSVEGERFLQEIRIVANLHHPHILTLLDSGEVDGVLFYVMPFVEGESLRAKLAREGELPVHDAVRILGEVADALAYAHQQGVVHRDVKPDNVLIEGRHVQVADFGVSKALNAARGESGVTTAGVAMGTPAYMAPEQAAGDPVVDHRADVYALGVLGYEMLTGRPPFTGATQRVLGAHVTEKPWPITQIRSTVPEEVAGVVERCLEKRPADRWQTAEALRAELEGLATPSGGSELWPKPDSGVPWRRRWAALVGAAVVAFLGVTSLLDRPDNPGGAPAPSLAVLPFDDFSGDTAQAYLSTGLTDALISSLAGIRGLDVRSRTSVMRYQGARPPAPEVGQDLGADLILEGSLLRVGEQIRITAQLIRAATDTNIWSGSYDGNLSDVLGLLGEVARTVAGQVKVVLTPQDEARLAAAPTTSPQVMDAMLRARYLVEQGTPQDLNRAVRILEGALDMDPAFAPAWGLLGLAHAARVGWFGGGEASEEVMPLAEQAARRALALDPGNVDAQVVVGSQGETEFRWQDAVDNYRRILDRDPSHVWAHIWLANLLTWMGELGEAEALTREAVRLDPLLPDAHNELAHVLYEAGREEEAIPHVIRSLELNPTNLYALGEMFRTLPCEGSGDLLPAGLEMGNLLDEGDRIVAAITAQGPLLANQYGPIISLYSRCGRPERARELYREMKERAKTEFLSPAFRARVHAGMGDMEGALPLLEEALAIKDVALVSLTNGKESQLLRDSLRGNPRFEAVVDGLGFPRGPEWSTPPGGGGEG